MISDAAANALVHVAAGIAIGSALQVALPSDAAHEDTQRLLTTAATQAALNGVAIAGATLLLRSEQDPTHGLLFIWALMATQPSLSLRLSRVAGVLREFGATQLASAGGAPSAGGARS